MFSVSGISVHFGGKDILDDISFVINAKDRIGLTGKNGAGKSTLLNIISGLTKPEQGQINIPEGKTVGYLPQQMKMDSQKTIYEETLTAFHEVNQLEKDIEKLHDYITHSTDFHSEEYLKKVTALHEKNDRFNYLDGNKKESNVEKVLKGLGFSENDFHRSVSEFSGGWKMRIELAKLLLVKPDLLLLDEPTNHLDIESILWVEDVLINYQGAVVMVSHDRMFLDRITLRTIEIMLGSIYDYELPYTKYLEARAERLETQMATFKNQQKFIDQQEKFITRFRAKSSKARQVQSKIKMLDKLDRVELDETDNSSIHFRFSPAPRSGHVVVDIADLSKSYDEKLILKKISLKILRGEKAAFVGKNGEGKTTLSKIIAGFEAFHGEMTIGHNVNLGYYAQVQENTLDENLTVLQTIDNEATDEWRNTSKIRGLLGSFLFRKNDIEKKVKVLSGGEKSRLALAKLLLKPYNLLVLDEPTNHLDMTSKEILKQALLDYDGTVIIVSHDRDFLHELTSKTYEFQNKQIKEHLGDINDFLLKHKAESFREFESTKTNTPKIIVEQDNSLSNKEKYLLKKEQEKELRKIQKAIEASEKAILHAENELKEISKIMEMPDFYADDQKVNEYTQKHSHLEKKLEKEMQHWDKLVKELEEKNLQNS